MNINLRNSLAEKNVMDLGYMIQKLCMAKVKMMKFTVKIKGFSVSNP